MTQHQTHDIFEDAGWRTLIGRLPATVDVAALARERRAFVRARGVPDAETLLRLALAYGATPLSLRGTAGWGEASGLAEISDVALLGRLQAAGDWLGDLVGALLSAALHLEAGGEAGGSIDGRRLRLVDATTIASPGAAALWRLHADYDLSKGRFVNLTLTDHHTPESLEHFSPAAGDVVVADSYHAKASQLHHVAATGADFIVRRGLTGCTVLYEDGRKLDSKRVLAAARDGGTLDMPVRVPPSPGATAEPIRARLVIQPLPEDKVAGALRRARKRAKKEGRAITQKRLQAAQLRMVLTALDRESADRRSPPLPPEMADRDRLQAPEKSRRARRSTGQGPEARTIVPVRQIDRCVARRGGHPKPPRIFPLRLTARRRPRSGGSRPSSSTPSSAP